MYIIFCDIFLCCFLHFYSSSGTRIKVSFQNSNDKSSSTVGRLAAKWLINDDIFMFLFNSHFYLRTCETRQFSLHIHSNSDTKRLLLVKNRITVYNLNVVNCSIGSSIFTAVQHVTVYPVQYFLCIGAFKHSHILILTNIRVASYSVFMYNANWHYFLNIPPPISPNFNVYAVFLLDVYAGATSHDDSTYTSKILVFLFLKKFLEPIDVDTGSLSTENFVLILSTYQSSIYFYALIFLLLCRKNSIFSKSRPKSVQLKKHIRGIVLRKFWKIVLYGVTKKVLPI